jgi:hypothetical protein
MDHTKLTLKEVILAQLARGVDVQPSHPGSSSPRGRVPIIKEKLDVGVSPTAFHYNKWKAILFIYTI